MFGHNNLSLTLLLTTLVIPLFAIESKLTGTNACIGKLKCHECIRTPSCAWCSKPGFNDTRCFLPHVNTKISSECPEKYIVNPDNEYYKVRYKELTKGSVSQVEGLIEKKDDDYKPKNYKVSKTSVDNNKEETVQLYPQEVNLKLRINEVQKIKLEYAQAKDYPVDLYYLMDLSNSMKDDKDKLSDLGLLLAESMNDITRDFRLGFGSFVDKVVMPYVSIVPAALKNPCGSDKTNQCAAPYGYRNHMQLSNDTNQFVNEVRNAPVSGNLDSPEGGFDAIMQAIVCRNDIGWREKARKLLLFSTDASFHYAGDGKLGGIVKPNDGCCHMNEAGMYTHSELQDYPSISQINLKVKENSVNIIWAVTKEQISIYSNLSKHIEGSSVAILSNDSSNIVDLVRDQYNAISSSIEMKDDASNYINLKYFSDCLGKIPFTETNKCDGLKIGNKVEFTVEVEVPACPTDRSEWNQKFTIYPIGINESLTVNLEMLCDCECEHSDSTDKGFELKSEKCDGHGDLSCGICVCGAGYSGKFCECNDSDQVQANANILGCYANNETETICKGRGSCNCNVCDCFQREDPSEEVWGPYCQCDNFSCDRKDNKLCSGNGKCVCGRCECKSGWSGDSCDCSTRKDTCSNNGLECSGHGICECGKCKCNSEGENRYTGNLCHICHGCPNRCEELKPCVLCTAFKVGNQTEAECNITCPNYEFEIVETLEVDVDKDETGCSGTDEQDCKYYYGYSLNVVTNILSVKVQRQRECPRQVFVLGIVLLVITAVVLIGLGLLLLWKLLTTIHDRREFAKFEKERMMAKWDASENPIYKQATSTFKNPTYKQS